MNALSLVYNPDHQQVLDHHAELLKAAEQARLANQAQSAEESQPHRQGLFRQLFAGRPAQKFTRTTNPTR